MKFSFSSLGQGFFVFLEIKLGLMTVFQKFILIFRSPWPIMVGPYRCVKENIDTTIHQKFPPKMGLGWGSAWGCCSTEASEPLSLTSESNLSAWNELTEESHWEHRTAPHLHACMCGCAPVHLCTCESISMRAYGSKRLTSRVFHNHSLSYRVFFSFIKIEFFHTMYSDHGFPSPNSSQVLSTFAPIQIHSSFVSY